MPLRAVCPSCRAKVVVDDAKAGADIVCHQCGGRFTAPSIMAGPPTTFAEAAGYFEEQSRSAGPGAGRRDHPEQARQPDSSGDFRVGGDFSLPTILADAAGRWRTTLVGLGLMFWALVALIGLLAPLFVLGGVAGTLEKQAVGQPPGPGHLAVVFSMFGLVCLMGILLIVNFVGMCMCCAAPPESGARPRAIAGVVLALLIVFGVGMTFLFLIFRAAHVQQAGGGADPFAGAIGASLAVAFGAAGVLFSMSWMLFHRAIALHFNNRALARGALLYLTFHAVITVIIGLLILRAMGAPPGDPSAGLAGGCTLVSGAALMIGHLIILRRTRTTVSRGTAPTLGDARDLG